MDTKVQSGPERNRRESVNSKILRSKLFFFPSKSSHDNRVWVRVTQRHFSEATYNAAKRVALQPWNKSIGRFFFPLGFSNSRLLWSDTPLTLCPSRDSPFFFIWASLLHTKETRHPFFLLLLFFFSHCTPTRAVQLFPGLSFARFPASGWAPRELCCLCGTGA